MATFSVFNPALSYSKYYAFSLLNSFILTASALLLNNALIPRYGMNGAALATALSDMIYFVPVVLITCRALKIQPFTQKHLWAMLIIVWLFALNQLWLRYIPSLNIWLDSIARTLIIGGVGILSSYKLHLSPELETMVRRALLR